MKKQRYPVPASAVFLEGRGGQGRLVLLVLLIRPSNFFPGVTCCIARVSPFPSGFGGDPNAPLGFAPNQRGSCSVVATSATFSCHSGLSYRDVAGATRRRPTLAGVTAGVTAGVCCYSLLVPVHRAGAQSRERGGVRLLPPLSSDLRCLTFVSLSFLALSLPLFATPPPRSPCPSRFPNSSLFCTALLLAAGFLSLEALHCSH
ncbi:hypothetical protein MRX96_022921 [Rhipicephalus microplus]